MFCVCLPGLRIFAIFHSIFVAVPKGSHCRFDHLIWTCDALPRIKNHLMSHQVLVQCGKKHLLHIGPQLYPISRQLPGRAPWRAKRVATCCLFCEKAFARLEWASFILCFFLTCDALPAVGRPQKDPERNTGTAVSMTCVFSKWTSCLIRSTRFFFQGKPMITGPSAWNFQPIPRCWRSGRRSSESTRRMWD